MKDIFITGTFRNDWNRAFNARLAEMFEAQGLTVFLPQRDSEQLGNRKETFLQDVAGIDQCKMIVAIGSRTQTANWGFEIGYAYQKKPVIVITDQEHPVELMPEGAAAKIIVVENLDATQEYIEELVSSIKTHI
ncbi:MAG: nucleoside 2-deoxyribosyltransferase [Candidatus Magasanikbacteria bacterium]|nr:nucleoside 2-deoxyribosyltransferase [Candidatus Magasanikbacteria bacterium]